MIYFIQEEETMAVKIGYTKNLTHRLTKMRSDNPKTLRIIRQEVDGTREQELKLHYYYSHLNLNGEWFTYDKSMDTIDLSTLPEIPKYIKVSIKSCNRRFKLYEDKFLKAIDEVNNNNTFITIGLLSKHTNTSKHITYKYITQEVKNKMNKINKDNFGTDSLVIFRTILKLAKHYEEGLKHYFIYVSAGVSRETYYKFKNIIKEFHIKYKNIDHNTIDFI